MKSIKKSIFVFKNNILLKIILNILLNTFWIKYEKSISIKVFRILNSEYYPSLVTCLFLEHVSPTWRGFNPKISMVRAENAPRVFCVFFLPFDFNQHPTSFLFDLKILLFFFSHAIWQLVHEPPRTRCACRTYRIDYCNRFKLCIKHFVLRRCLIDSPLSGWIHHV